MMDEITIVKKPDNISYEEIREVLQEAHKVHHEKGVFMRVPEMSPEELEKRIGDDGVCFVALKDGKVVGTASCIFREIKKWYHTGKAMEETMLAILPSCQGMHFSSRFNKIREEEAVKHNVKVITGNTAEINTKRLMIAKKDGFINVDYRWNYDHYSVYFAKWLDGCPYPVWYCAFRFHCKKREVRLKRSVIRLKHRVFG